MSTMRGFQKVEKGGYGHPEGVFITISNNPGQHRRIYLSVEAREFLDHPRYIAYYTRDDQLAIRKTDEEDEQAYKMHPRSGHVAAEMPLRELDVEQEGRVYLETKDDALIADFS